MSKVITQHLRYIEELYKIIEKHIDTAKLDEVFKKIHKKYKCDNIFCTKCLDEFMTTE
jgi:hypothetical protein